MSSSYYEYVWSVFESDENASFVVRKPLFYLTRKLEHITTGLSIIGKMQHTMHVLSVTRTKWRDKYLYKKASIEKTVFYLRC